MTMEQPAATSAMSTDSGDPEKTIVELERALADSKLEKKTSTAEAEPTSNGTHASPPEPQLNGTHESTTNGVVPAMNLPHSSADGPLKTLFDAPLETSKPKLRPDLTIDQDAKYKNLVRHVEKWTELPETSARGSKSTPLTDAERMFLTRECLLRYLRATTWNVASAETRLKNTLIWRREYGLQRITSDYISIESETGKQVIIGWDNEGRSCQYMRPSKQNTERGPRQIEHLVFMLERSIDLMPPGQETLALIINFAETKSGQGATLAQGRQTLNILQNHYRKDSVELWSQTFLSTFGVSSNSLHLSSTL